jgi:hypothetical protein
MLKKLTQLCNDHPQRFHILGCNWILALNELKDTLKSADTSKVLDAARYGTIFFLHSKTGRLTQAPVRSLGAEYAHLLNDREERIIQSAAVMSQYFNGLEQDASNP